VFLLGPSKYNDNDMNMKFQKEKMGSHTHIHTVSSKQCNKSSSSFLIGRVRL